MAHLTDLDLTAPADSLYSGGVVLNTWRTRIDALNDVLGDITSVTTAGRALLDDVNAAAQRTTLGLGSIATQAASSVAITGGSITGITTLTAGGALDIGAHGFRANTLTADGLTATRVIFAGASGLLSDSAAFTFVTDTLTVTKLGAFQAAGAINFDSQNMTNVDIDSGAIDGVTIGGAAAPTVTNLGAVTTCDINGGTIGGITFDGALTMLIGSDVDGDIYYRASNVLTRLGKGTATHVLTMNAGGTAPEWAAASGGVDTSGTPVDDDFAKFTDADTIEGRSYSETRTDLGLVIGTDVLAYDAGLSNLAGISMAADKFYYTSADNTHVAATVTSFARTMLDDANAATVLGTLGLSTNLPNLADAEVTQLEAIGDVTISYAQWGYLGAATQGVWVTTRKARAHAGTAQAISTGSLTKINLDTEDYDPGSNFDHATNYRWVTPVAGYYSITAGIMIGPLSAASPRFQLVIYKNGAGYRSAEMYGVSGGYPNFPYSDTYSLAANDYLELYVFQNSGANQNTIPADCHLAVHFMSDAEA